MYQLVHPIRPTMWCGMILWSNKRHPFDTQRPGQNVHSFAEDKLMLLYGNCAVQRDGGQGITGDEQSQSAVITWSNLSWYYHWYHKQNLNQTLISQPTSNMSPSRASYGVSIVRIWVKIDCIITAPHCTWGVIPLNAIKLNPVHISRVWHLFSVHLTSRTTICYNWLDERVEFLFKLSKFQLSMHCISWQARQPWQLNWVGSNSKIYLEMSGGTWIVLHPDQWNFCTKTSNVEIAFNDFCHHGCLVSKADISIDHVDGSVSILSFTFNKIIDLCLDKGDGFNLFYWIC